VALDSETVFQKVMLIAARRNLAIHHLTVQQIAGKLAVSFDLEVEGSMPLLLAHETATVLEDAIRGELGSDVEVESHIEPQPERLLAGSPAMPRLAAAVEATLRHLALSHQRLSDIHNLRVRSNDEGTFVHYHCRFDGQQPVERVHDDIDRIEAALKAEFPDIRRVIAHAEPLGYRRHGPGLEARAEPRT
jgi:divalent metal cation (Fe/Co/Zn/Cd) transporter